MSPGTTPALPLNRPGQVLFASLIGTAIEYFDFYIYATAAVLLFTLEVPGMNQPLRFTAKRAP